MLFINNQSLTEDTFNGVYIVSNIGWKGHINYFVEGILAKIRYYDSQNDAKAVLYLARAILRVLNNRWSNAYQWTLQPLLTLQKKASRLITFSRFTEQSSPLFEDLNVMRLSDIIILQFAVFMYKFHYQLLPSVFDTFFNPVRNIP